MTNNSDQHWNMKDQYNSTHLFECFVFEWREKNIHQLEKPKFSVV